MNVNVRRSLKTNSKLPNEWKIFIYHEKKRETLAREMGNEKNDLAQEKQDKKMCLK